VSRIEIDHEPSLDLRGAVMAIPRSTAENDIE